MKSKITTLLMLCSILMMGQEITFVTEDLSTGIGLETDDAYTVKIPGKLPYKFPIVDITPSDKWQKENTIQIGEGVILVEDHTGQKRVEVDPDWLDKFYEKRVPVMLPTLSDRDRVKLMEKEQDIRKGMGMLEDFER